ncbi:methylamine utilization protein [Roseiconus lacunae]|uniref:Methylamine utilization protein n=1 Tax=Roseiconus lacunae TaxID=2605694 RepID=A0ABT7PII8_9BACT|nr:methylamine utilization protein [Roseiconus lacunae]MCD0458424.1 methylamine utilization protein [Roseiconus lacunae]MDM4016312.1 methylamine utilization protein [Roseiconus lacunae]WRQ52085.1 methylamine utilization protein [Stieleria sp. HD01]
MKLSPSFFHRLLVAGCATAAVSASLFATPASAETGTLRMTFKLKGDAPKKDPLNPNVDQTFCGKAPIPDESLVVNDENKGIKNVIVYVYTGRRGTELPEMELKPETHILANDKCRFEPHVLIAKKGDTIRVTNPDDVTHNANFQFFNNTQQNLTVPPGAQVEVALKDAEPAPTPVACNIHSWMKAQVLVVDHPFAAVTDDDGVLEIEGLPVGEVIFRANHETGSLKEVVVDGDETSWRSSRFEVDIKPGVNEMTVEVPVAAFQ